MSIYGEGLYARADGRLVDSVERNVEQLAAGEWEPRDERFEPLVPMKRAIRAHAGRVARSSAR